jgi:hypothetical protein
VLFLLDKSAHELARRHPDARRTLETMAVTGVLATCAIVELEISYSARNVTGATAQHEEASPAGV